MFNQKKVKKLEKEIEQLKAENLIFSSQSRGYRDYLMQRCYVRNEKGQIEKYYKYNERHAKICNA